MKQISGKVISNKGQNTVIVAVETIVVHPLYKKRLRRTRKLAAHTQIPGINIGDSVTLVQCRPMSKTKHFIVKDVASKVGNPVTPLKAVTSKGSKAASINSLNSLFIEGPAQRAVTTNTSGSYLRTSPKQSLRSSPAKPVAGLKTARRKKA